MTYKSEGRPKSWTKYISQKRTASLKKAKTSYLRNLTMREWFFYVLRVNPDISTPGVFVIKTMEMFKESRNNEFKLHMIKLGKVVTNVPPNEINERHDLGENPDDT